MIKQIEEARERMAAIRRRRHRCIEFAGGKQWGDTIRTDKGRVMTEGAWMRRHGRVPITNNLIRRAIKGIIGYWDRTCERPASDPLKNIDARTLQELIISGIEIQPIGAKDDPLLPGNCVISPDNFFCDKFAEPTLIGATYSFAPSRVIAALSGGNADKALQIADTLKANDDTDISIIEVWHKQTLHTLQWHDPAHGIYCHTECTRAHLQDIERLSQQRAEMGKSRLQTRYLLKEQWEQRWLTERGDLLWHKRYNNTNATPYIVGLYPGSYSETESVVADLIEPQKQINRLVSTLDCVIHHSAKGVLLYPADQLPRGMTWKEIRTLWDEPGSILPFSPTRKGLTPMQINSTGRLDGAMQMLMLQMKLFDDMAGIDSATSGSRTSATGSEMLKTGIEQSHMVLRDLLTAFDDMLSRRDRLLQITK